MFDDIKSSELLAFNELQDVLHPLCEVSGALVCVFLLNLGRLLHIVQLVDSILIALLSLLDFFGHVFELELVGGVHAVLFVGFILLLLEQLHLAHHLAVLVVLLLVHFGCIFYLPLQLLNLLNPLSLLH